MSTNFRYRAYKVFVKLKEHINTGSRSSDVLVKMMSRLKDWGIQIYVFYVSKFKYSISTRLFDKDSKVLVNCSVANPRDIVYISNMIHTDQKSKNKVKGGNWDLHSPRFDGSVLFRDVSEALKEQKPIMDSICYREIQDALVKQSNPSTEVEQLTFSKKWQELVDLYRDFEQNKDKLTEIVIPSLPEVVVDIGRSGALLLHDGELLLALAKLFELNSIDVMINVRHINWINFRKRFHDLVITVGSTAYQPPLHPDLSFIPAEQSCVERYRIISENLDAHEGLLLDLGANAGYFSIKFENLGFDCVAAEYFPNYIYCLSGQKEALNKRFKIVEGSFLDQPDLLNQEYDVVLALNVFSHLIVHKETFEKLDEFLENLNCKTMIFEPYSPNDPQMKNSYVTFTEDEFAEYVRIKLQKTNARIIGKASDGRWLYKIS